MTSRRGLIGAAVAATAAGSSALIALNTSQRIAHSSPAGDQAPDFSVALLGSRVETRLADYSGRVLLLNFWATWCAPCRVEMPWLARTDQHYGSAGLNILGVNMDDGDMANVERFTREMGVTYAIARSNDAIVASYGGVRFLPQSFLIGRHGQIVRRSFGKPPPGQFEEAIEAALATA